MNFTIDNFSIVIIAQSHNPSILNPDFLKGQGIVDSSFTPINVLCTQPVSQIAYQEGFTISAEFEKLQLVDTVSSRIPYESPIPEIAIKYIQRLPFVQYTAVGLNFIGHHSFDDQEAAACYLPDMFLKGGKWATYGASMPLLGLKFLYSFPTYKCLIMMDTIEKVPQDLSAKGAITITVNYHSDLTTVEEISSFINDWNKHFNNLGKIIDDTFPEGKS